MSLVKGLRPERAVTPVWGAAGGRRACLLGLGAVLVAGPGCLHDDPGSDNDTDNGFVPPTPPPPQQRTLGVPFVFQQTPVWCWAAVSEMVFRYYGFGTTQCQTLSFLYRADCCTFPGFCQTTAPIELIQQTLLTLGGLRSIRRFSAISAAEVVAEINSGRPMILAYAGSFSGHVVVLYGYESAGQILHLHDPLYGSFRVPYALTFSYGGSLRWVDTLTGIQR